MHIVLKITLIAYRLAKNLGHFGGYIFLIPLGSLQKYMILGPDRYLLFLNRGVISGGKINLYGFLDKVCPTLLIWDLGTSSFPKSLKWIFPKLLKIPTTFQKIFNTLIKSQGAPTKGLIIWRFSFQVEISTPIEI